MDGPPMFSSRTAGVLAAGILASLMLSACSAADDSAHEAHESVSESVDSTPEPEDSSEPSGEATSLQLSTETLETILTDIQFDPSAFATTEEMFASIYPGVTVAPACLEVLGIGKGDTTANVAFGPSIDRSLTAHVSSFATVADDFFTQLSASADACIADPQVTFQGQPVEATVERSEIHPTAFALELSASIMGSQVSVIGNVEQFQENVVMLAGWDPATNKQNVPRATGMIVEELSTARIAVKNEKG